MKFRKFFFSALFNDRMLVKIIDNIFMFSKLNLDSYLRMSDNTRRRFFLNKSLLSVGIGHRRGDPLKVEKWFIEKVLVQLFPVENEYVFFDVGANIGEYSKILHSVFFKARIFSFEPNPITFSVLESRLNMLDRFHLFNLGFSTQRSIGNLYSYESDLVSGQASLLKDVFLDIYKNKDIKCFHVNLDTIDDFCVDKMINDIHFLKVDTEGFEFNILQGALNMISRNKISVIQFEFNEMNIINKVFLKNFYELLFNYKFYRLSDGELIDISEYKSDLEIFHYQDIICVSKFKKDFIKIVDRFVVK